MAHFDFVLPNSEMFKIKKENCFGLYGLLYHKLSQVPPLNLN